MQPSKTPTKSAPRASKISTQITKASPIKKAVTTIRLQPVIDLQNHVVCILLWNTFYQRLTLNAMQGQDGATNYTMFMDEYANLKLEWADIFEDAIQEKARTLKMSVESITDIDCIFRPSFAQA
jgi:hypothetical protein